MTSLEEKGVEHITGRDIAPSFRVQESRLPSIDEAKGAQQPRQDDWSLQEYIPGGYLLEDRRQGERSLCDMYFLY